MPTQVKSLKSSKNKKSILSVKQKDSETQSTQDPQEMIAEAAYYKAEQRGFIPGFEQEDWLAAENEIHSMLEMNH